MAKNTNGLSVSKWWARIDACRRVRSEKFRVWQDSVSYRRGKPFRSTPPEDTVNVPADWARTKNKISQLFYQVPELILLPRAPQWSSVAPTFAAALNFEMSEKIHAETMMEECLADVINAAGVMICMVEFEASFEDRPYGPPQAGVQPSPLNPEGSMDETSGQVPVVEGAVVGEEGAAPNPEMVPTTVYQCYKTNRVSPAHFLWPLEHVKKNWRQAHWLGREGYMPVAEAVRKEWVEPGTEGVQITDQEWLLVNEFSDLKPADSYIKFVELFYYPYYFDPAETDPRKIRRIVLLEDKRGKREKPAVDEDFKWQKRSADGKRWIGMTTLPLKVGTLTHISDMAIPPSDSEIARPQVRELIKLRTLQVRQREHSIPLRWFDVNQVDPMVAIKLRQGKWQDIIPMNGPGEHAIGEVARAQYPPENWQFDKIIRFDLDESWSMGAMQQGITTPGETTATEVKEISGANDTRLDLERQWVMRFFLEVAEGVGQLMQMFADEMEYAPFVGDDGQRVLRQWNKDLIPGEYIFKYKPDSQLRVDISQRRNEGLNLYKLVRKDPLLNPTLLVRRVLEDHGLDWTKMMAQPQPPKPERPKVSASFKGEDLTSPLAVALINKSDTPITAEDVKAAQAVIDAAAPQPMVQPSMGNEGAPVAPGSIPHPGPADRVSPLDRRYEQGGDHGIEGSRDSGMPTPQQ